MADVIPLRGILYARDKIKNLADVTTPPYDVISTEQQDFFYEQHPHNVIRLILNKKTSSDTPSDNCHTRAAACFHRWLDDAILVRDAQPAFYFARTDFTHQNRRLSRFGLIGRVGLEPFDKRIILPHEKTFSKVKSERFELMRACQANFSPIFSLYPDTGGLLKRLQASVPSDEPEMDFVDTAGHRQRLWRISDPSVQHVVTEAMQDKCLFIADGHHRYETALNYRDWVASHTHNFSCDHPANYVLMYLCSMADPGLVILPAHRLLRRIEVASPEKFAAKWADDFEVSAFAWDPKDPLKSLEDLMSALKAKRSQNAMGAFFKNASASYLLALKPHVMKQKYGQELPGPLRHLDVTVLTRLVFMDLLGFDQSRLDNEKLIAYTSSAREALEAVMSGKFDAAFILNPTPIDHVRAIAEEGLIMPRKSTYFYPKVITGQVINSLLPNH